MKEQNDNRETGGEATVLINVWAMTLQLPMRRKIGKNMLGITALFGLIFVVVYGGLLQCLPVLVWAGVYFASILTHRVSSLIRRFRGTETHSRYNGYPWLGELLGRRFDEVAVKSTLEPLLAAVIGLISARYGQAAMVYFIGGAGCMLISTRLTAMEQQKRLDDMRDAMIEGQLLRPALRRRW